MSCWAEPAPCPIQGDSRKESHVTLQKTVLPLPLTVKLPNRKFGGPPMNRSRIVLTYVIPAPINPATTTVAAASRTQPRTRDGWNQAKGTSPSAMTIAILDKASTMTAPTKSVSSALRLAPWRQPAKNHPKPSRQNSENVLDAKSDWLPGPPTRTEKRYRVAVTRVTRPRALPEYAARSGEELARSDDITSKMRKAATTTRFSSTGIV